ncbi:MAG: tyrosine-protein phosphatase [Bacteroidales bacterium]|jgi:protein-tyrosine phosphatase|nr:tyrosine-protein phosphatase [Bacteroidales bacterium]MDD2570369.1 tyrosine-protein phosphatase [Bacteroidales bacterium]MDD2813221.1 tyrosine-protein phosphatase [Bacteroidales bacterium]MDD3385138.1 tyrosine-protein phosphatase [Bacteroidales bacterium]MDD3811780.1 tyrosine-protein phosphatase [Bacteroidales bacterium]
MKIANMLTRINFRDIGQIPLPDGRRFKPGLLYRSAVLQRLNQEDRNTIDNLGIRTVVDLRSIQEQERKPGKLPGQNRVSLPCNIDQRTRERLKPLLFRRNSNESIIAVMDNVYAEMVDLMMKPMAALIHLILNPNNLPMIIHCRAGKDRTGFAAAMIQRLMGAELKPVFDDYLRSNLFMKTQIRQGQWKLRLITAGLMPKGNLQAAFEVRREFLQTAFDYIDEKYKGVEGYFLAAGISKENIQELTTILTEPA